MSRKKRVLRRLRLVESDLQKTAKTNSKAMWGIVSKGLIAARDIWQEGLTEKTYLAYGEIYDGLILASQQMAASEEKSIEADTISLCRELLQYLIGQTEKETAVKKDIVFLPYKASMWDSLESVWKAAYADKEHCNAYVMPVPYCDRNPDGSAAEWHCERELFPKYVPTLDWQKVDLMAWHPDVVVYHYPYDDYNRVTSLDGRYYSRNLRKCADKLIYIPYFVLDEPCTEKSVEHFVMTHGVLNADKVIVQSEAMRELYINILMKRTNRPDRAYWEERISGAGSPKIEKVLTSKKEDFEMPEKWKKLVDGKKVILYNTSLTAMLQNSDKVCDKLRYVFDVFRNRDDVVLWWRPHPLMKATFHSMRPQYEEEYLSLEKQYIEEVWGIYDDSADLHRAITWSDAYYGDASSVVQLYKVTGKRVLLQDISSGSSDSLKLLYDHMILDERDNTVWFVTNMRHGGISKLWKLDLSSDEVHCMSNIDARCFSNTELPYSALGLINNKILVAPCWSNGNFFEYDILTKQSKFIPIVSEARWSRHMGRVPLCSNVVQHGDSLFFICNMNGVIIEYNGVTGKISYHREWSEVAFRYIPYDEMIFEAYSCEKCADKLYLVPYEKNIIIELDLENFNSKVYRIPYEVRVVFIKFYDGFFWLLSNRDDFLTRWDKKKNEFRQSDIPYASQQRYSFCGLTTYNNRIKIWPLQSNVIYEISLHGNVAEDFTLENILKNNQKDSFNFSFETCENGKTFLLRRSDGGLLELNQTENVIQQHLPRVFLNNVYYSCLPQVMKESEDISLNKYLELKNLSKKMNSSMHIGNDIMNYILR